MNDDRVIAVIPSLGRNIDRLNSCINSVKKYSNFSNLKIILVDNSPDGSLRNTYNIDEVIGLGVNLGFVGALEIVRRKFDAEFIWTLQDDITVNDFYIENGTFDANDHNIVADTYSFYAYEGVLPVINMGSGTWEATGGGQVWKVEEDMGFSVTINRENSTIKLTNIDSEPKFFLGDGKTYNNLWIVGSNVAKYWIVDSNTFNDLKINPGNEISFSDISTTTLSTLTAVGTADDPITIDSFDYDDDGLGQHTLSKSSGTVNTYYLDISNSNATGGATWIAYNSTDTTNNDGWLFVTNASVTTTVQTLTSSLLDPTIIIGASAIVITNASSLISSIIEPKIYINYPWTTGSHDKSNWTDVSTPSTNYSPSSSVSTNFSNQATTSTNFSNTNHKSIDWT
jgi:hypothetical protein